MLNFIQYKFGKLRVYILGVTVYNCILSYRRGNLQKKKEKHPLEATQLIEILDYYSEKIEDIQMDVMFVQKSTSKKNPYKIAMLVCDDIDIKDMMISTFDNIKKTIGERQFDKYDLEISADDTVQTIDKGQVINYQLISDSITVDYTDENTINEKTDYDKFDFIVVRVSDTSSNNPKPQISIFKKHYKSPVKFKGTKSYLFNGRKAKEFTQKLLVIGSNAEAINVDDYFYIFHREYFNSMLKFKDVYYKIIDENTDEIKTSNLLDDSEQFVLDCRNDGRYVTRLTKAILLNSFKNVKEYRERVPNIIHKHNLSLKLNADGQVVYNKESIGEMLNLLLQHYVTSDLTDKSLIAKAIEKYE